MCFATTDWASFLGLRFGLGCCSGTVDVPVRQNRPKSVAKQSHNSENQSKFAPLATDEIRRWTSSES